LDVIKCDLAINPYFIKTENKHENKYDETLYIIDRKTLYNIYRTKSHPFTRQFIDKKMMDEFNELPHIKRRRQEALNKINCLI